MAIKLATKEASDLFVRMDVVLDMNSGDVYADEQGEPYWIELWHEGATACRSNLARLRGPGLRLAKQYESAASMSNAEADKLYQDLVRSTAEGLAYRVKAWRLPTDTEEDDTEPTFQKAKGVFLSEDHDLRAYTQKFLEDADFTTRSDSNS